MAKTDAGAHLEPLVAAAARGDTHAFSQLVDATSNLVTSIGLAVLRDFEDSRDVAQDVFLAAWRDLSTLRNPASFLPWLRQIARNRSHHLLRSRIRARRHESNEADPAVLQAVADSGPGAEALLLAEENRRLVAEVLDRLSDDAREVVLLYYREEQSVRQVAMLLDLSEDAVKQRLSRARAALRSDVLASLGETMRHTATGASFTAAITVGAPPAATAAITVGAPPAATAATLAAPSAANVGTVAKIMAAFGWGAIGPLASLIGIVRGGRQAARDAVDEEERRAWRLHTWANAVLTTVVWGMMPVWWRLFPRPWGYVIPLLGFIVICIVLHHVWTPRILARRHAAERREEPARAHAARARERRQRILGWSIGMFFAALGLAAALWQSS